ncbi:hypothetical protein SDC9_143803 [bioreactor metagenome]|uniref:Uncharacterized protein n=1 Tax=bioreactor metagenome TaxID=1076179 RepID=A0A645E5H8_9ZZZZ
MRAGLKHFAEIHSEAHQHDRHGQQMGRQSGGVAGEGIAPGDGEDDAAHDCQTWSVMPDSGRTIRQRDEGGGHGEKNDFLQNLHKSGPLGNFCLTIR